MSFNTSKCSIILFGNKNEFSDRQYTLNGETLKHVDSIKYLGLLLNSSLRWDDHIEKKISEANKMLGMLRRTLSIASTKVRTLAFKALVSFSTTET